MNMSVDLARLLRYEFWADREAVEAVRRAGGAAPQRALAIMNHVLAAAELWLTRLRGEKVKVEVWPALSIDEMSMRIDRLGAAWQAWANAATTADLERKIAYVNSLGESWSSTARDIVTHLAIHAAYHRGQVAILLGQAGAKPAYTDFIHATRQKMI